MSFRRINGILALLATALTALFGVGDWRSEWWLLPVALAGTYLALTLLFCLWIAGLSLTVPLSREYAKPSRFYAFWFNAGYRYLCDVARVRVHVTGTEKLPEGTFLLVSNHRSKFDNMIQSVVLRRYPLAFISKPENFSIPMGRHYMRRACYLSIDRSDVRQSYGVFTRATAMIRDGVTSVGVFPEGTRSATTEMGEFHDGCFMMAQRSGKPLVVTTVQGTQNIHRHFPWKRTDVTFDILGVLTPEQLAGKRSGEIAAITRDMMQNNLDRCQETEKEGRKS